MNRWLQDRTWITWYKQKPGGVLGLVWSQVANPSFPVSNQDVVGYRQRLRFRCPVPQLDTSQIVPIGNPAVLGNPLPTYSLLRFYRMVISLRVLVLNIMRTRAHLMSKDGMLCGSVSLDGFDETGLP